MSSTDSVHRANLIRVAENSYQYVYRYLHDSQGQPVLSHAIAGPLEKLIDALAELAEVKLASRLPTLAHPIRSEEFPEIAADAKVIDDRHLRI